MATAAPEAEVNEATPEQSDASPNGEAGTEAKAADKMVNFAFRIPVALKDVIDAKGKEENVTGNEWARQYVARAFDFTLPPARQKTPKTKKYEGLSKEERSARIKQDKTIRNAVAKALLAQFEQGAIRLDEGALVVDGKPLDMEAIKAAIS